MTEKKSSTKSKHRAVSSSAKLQPHLPDDELLLRVLKVLKEERSAMLPQVAKAIKSDEQSSELEERISALLARFSKFLPVQILDDDAAAGTRVLWTGPEVRAVQLGILQQLANNKAVTLEDTADSTKIGETDLEPVFTEIARVYSGFGIARSTSGDLQRVPWLAEGQPLSRRASANREGKEAIAKAVAKRIVEAADPIATVFFGAGSQSALIATKLMQDYFEQTRDYTVLTNNLEVARELGQRGYEQVHILGGRFQSFISGTATENIAQITLEASPPDVAFVSWHFVTATSNDIEFRANNDAESGVKKAVTRFTKRLLIYGADGMKLGRHTGQVTVRASELADFAEGSEKEVEFVTETLPRERFSSAEAARLRESFEKAAEQIATKSAGKSTFNLTVLS